MRQIAEVFAGALVMTGFITLGMLVIELGAEVLPWLK